MPTSQLPAPPTVRPRPQLENSGLYNTAFTIIGPYYSCLCLAPSVFLGVSGSKGNSDGKGRGTVAQTRTKPCISGIPGELSSRYAVKDTHEEFFFFPCTCPRNAEGLLSHCLQRTCGSSDTACGYSALYSLQLRPVTG